MGAHQETEFISFANPPVEISNALEDDLSGVYFNRMCTGPAVSG